MPDEVERQVGRATRRAGGMCLTEQMTVYVPTKNPGLERAAREVREKMSDVFGGSTEWDGHGCWWSGLRQVCEPVKVIKAAHNCGDRSAIQDLRDLIGRVAHRESQQTVGIETTQSFYIVPPEALIAGKRPVVRVDQK